MMLEDPSRQRGKSYLDSDASRGCGRRCLEICNSTRHRHLSMDKLFIFRLSNSLTESDFTAWHGVAQGSVNCES